MFYNLKILFFIILFIFSCILFYFINQQILLIGIFENFFFSSTLIFISTIITSYIITFIIIKISNFIPLYIKNKSNKNFISWLIFTIISYIIVFIAFAFATSY